METLDGVKVKKFSRNKKAIERRKRALKRLEEKMPQLDSNIKELEGHATIAEKKLSEAVKNKDHIATSSAKEQVDYYKQKLEVRYTTKKRMEKEISTLKTRI